MNFLTYKLWVDFYEKEGTCNNLVQVVTTREVVQVQAALYMSFCIPRYHQLGTEVITALKNNVIIFNPVKQESLVVMAKDDVDDEMDPFNIIQVKLCTRKRIYGPSSC